MVDFLYTAFLPVSKQTVRLTELKFDSYKQLVKILTNDSDELIAKGFDDILKQCCQQDISQYTFID